jgi:hypothetical protein
MGWGLTEYLLASYHATHSDCSADLSETQSLRQRCTPTFAYILAGYSPCERGTAWYRQRPLGTTRFHVEAAEFRAQCLDKTSTLQYCGAALQATSAYWHINQTPANSARPNIYRGFMENHRPRITPGSCLLRPASHHCQCQCVLHVAV